MANQTTPDLTNRCLADLSAPPREETPPGHEAVGRNPSRRGCCGISASAPFAFRRVQNGSRVPLKTKQKQQRRAVTTTTDFGFRPLLVFTPAQASIVTRVSCAGQDGVPYSATFWTRLLVSFPYSVSPHDGPLGTLRANEANLTRYGYHVTSREGRSARSHVLRSQRWCSS